MLLGLVWTTGAAAEIWTGSGEIVFDATSTLHDFSGAAPLEPFAISLVRDGPFAVLGGTAMVAVAKLDTRNAKRDANMRNMFATERYPVIRGTLAPIRLDPTAPPATLPIDLVVRDRSCTVAATLSTWEAGENRLRVELAMTLSLRELGLEPPVLLGFIRVGDAVAVRARVALEHGPVAVPP